MSLDIVDDLHAAEDYIATARLRARDFIEEFTRWQAGRDVPDRVVVALRHLNIATNRPFVRPTCTAAHEDGVECDVDCGGVHPWRNER